MLSKVFILEMNGKFIGVYSTVEKALVAASLQINEFAIQWEKFQDVLDWQPDIETPCFNSVFGKALQYSDTFVIYVGAISQSDITP